jgi:hypothetical protein
MPKDGRPRRRDALATSLFSGLVMSVLFLSPWAWPYFVYVNYYVAREPRKEDHG